MAAPTAKEDDKEVLVFDRRTTAAPEVKVSLSGAASFLEFKEKVKKALDLTADDFVIATTNREEIKNDDTFEYIEKGDTLYILKDINQELCAPAPYAFAELIDNSLAATALNDGPRKIELRLYVDDPSVSKNCVVVIDNGKGMTPRQLNNWAIYRLSKFTRREKQSNPKGMVKATTVTGLEEISVDRKCPYTPGQAGNSCITCIFDRISGAASPQVGV